MDDALPLWRAVDDYFGRMLFPEDDALVAAREAGDRTTMPHAEVAPNQGKLLGLLTQLVGATRVLEFGTLAGYSTVWLARAVGPEGRVTTLELEQQNASVAQATLERAGLADRVDVVVGPALHSARQLVAAATPPYDLVFIDADKPSNPAYLAVSMELTRVGSVIVIDNVVRGGAVADEDSTDPRVQGVRLAIAQIADDPRLDATAIQTVGSKGWDGFTLIRRTA